MDKWLCIRRSAYSQVYPNGSSSKPLFVQSSESNRDDDDAAQSQNNQKDRMSIAQIVSNFLFGVGDSSDKNSVDSSISSQKVVYQFSRKKSVRRSYLGETQDVSAIGNTDSDASRVLGSALIRFSEDITKTFISPASDQSSGPEFIKYSIPLLPCATSYVDGAFSISLLSDLMLRHTVNNSLDSLFGRDRFIDEAIDILNAINLLLDEKSKTDLIEDSNLSCERLLTIIDICCLAALAIYNSKIDLSMQFNLALLEELASLARVVDKLSTDSIESELTRMIWAQVVLRHCFLFDAILRSSGGMLLRSNDKSIDSFNLVVALISYIQGVSTITAQSRHINEKIFYLLSSYFWYNCRSLTNFIVTFCTFTDSSTGIDESLANRKKTQSIDPLLRKLFHSISLCQPASRELMPEMLRFFNAPLSSLLPQSLAKFEIFSDSNSKLLALSSTGSGVLSHHEAWRMTRLRWVLVGLQTMVEIDKCKSMFFTSSSKLEWLSALSESIICTLSFQDKHSWNSADVRNHAWSPAKLTLYFLDVWLTLMRGSSNSTNYLKSLESKAFADMRRELTLNMVKFTAILKNCKKYKNISAATGANAGCNNYRKGVHITSSSNNSKPNVTSTDNNNAPSVEPPSPFLLNMETPNPHLPRAGGGQQSSAMVSALSLPLAGAIGSDSQRGSGRRLFPFSNREEMTSGRSEAPVIEVKSSTSKPTVFSPSFSIGEHVSGLCILKNGSKRWFPGTITSFDESDGTYTLTFNDGDVHNKKPESEIRCLKQRGVKTSDSNSVSTSMPNLPPRPDNTEISPRNPRQFAAPTSAKLILSPDADRRPSVTSLEVTSLSVSIAAEPENLHVDAYLSSSDDDDDDDSHKVFEIPSVLGTSSHGRTFTNKTVPKMALSQLQIASSSIHMQSGMSLSCALLQELPAGVDSEREANMSLCYSPVIDSNVPHRYDNSLELVSSYDMSRVDSSALDGFSNSAKSLAWQANRDCKSGQDISSSSSIDNFDKIASTSGGAITGNSDVMRLSESGAQFKLKMPIPTHSARSDMPASARKCASPFSTNDFFDEVSISEDMLRTWVKSFGLMSIAILENCFRGSIISERLITIMLEFDANMQTMHSVSNSRPTSTQISTRVITSRNFNNGTSINNIVGNITSSSRSNIDNLSVRGASSNINILFMVREFLENCYFDEVLHQIACYCISTSSSLYRLLKLLHSSFFTSCLMLHIDDNGTKIGEGGFGSVFKVTCPRSCTQCIYKCFDCNCYNRNKSYAIKRSSRERAHYDSPVILDIYNEISCLETLSSSVSGSNKYSVVPKLMDFGVRGDEYWIISECGGLNLLEWRAFLVDGPSLSSDKPSTKVAAYGALSPNRVAMSKLKLNSLTKCLTLYIDALYVVKTLHASDIVHFDLKCNNFVLRDDNEFNKNYSDIILDHISGSYSGSLFVTDFGESIPNMSEYSKLVSSGDRSSRCRGTLFVQSPEMLCINDLSNRSADLNPDELPTGVVNEESSRNGGTPKDETRSQFPSMPSDIWSIGALLVELITGKYLFAEKAWVDLFVSFCMGEMQPLNLDCLDASFDVDVPADVISDIKLIVTGAMAQKANQRLSIDVLLSRCISLVSKTCTILKQLDSAHGERRFIDSISPRVESANSGILSTSVFKSCISSAMDFTAAPTLIYIGENLFIDFSDIYDSISLLNHQSMLNSLSQISQDNAQQSSNLLQQKLGKLSHELETRIIHTGVNSVNYSGKKYPQKFAFLSKSMSINTQAVRAVYIHEGQLADVLKNASMSSPPAGPHFEINLAGALDCLRTLLITSDEESADAAVEDVANSIFKAVSETFHSIKTNLAREAFMFVICPRALTNEDLSAGSDYTQPLLSLAAPSSALPSYNGLLFHVALMLIMLINPLRPKKSHNITSKVLIDGLVCAIPSLTKTIKNDLLASLKVATVRKFS